FIKWIAHYKEECRVRAEANRAAQSVIRITYGHRPKMSIVVDGKRFHFLVDTGADRMVIYREEIMVPPVKCLLVTVVLFQAMNMAPKNPHQPQKVTWAVISTGNGEILNNTVHEAVPGA
ncbi:hypothetical protein A6R68_07589, partial [Neotoma lepida]